MTDRMHIMPYTINYRFDAPLLRCQVEGKRKVSESLELWRTLLKKCQLDDIRYLLLVYNLKGVITSVEMLNAMTPLLSLIKKEIPQLTIALVDHNPESLQHNYIIGILGKLENIRGDIFDNVHDAEKWILDKIRADRNEEQPVI